MLPPCFDLIPLPQFEELPHVFNTCGKPWKILFKMPQPVVAYKLYYLQLISFWGTNSGRYRQGSLQHRSSGPEVFCKKGVFKSFGKFTGKHLCLSAFNFTKKETLTQVLSCEFCKTFKNTFFIEHLQWLLLATI